MKPQKALIFKFFNKNRVFYGTTFKNEAELLIEIRKGFTNRTSRYRLINEVYDTSHHNRMVILEQFYCSCVKDLIKKQMEYIIRDTSGKCVNMNKIMKLNLFEIT